MLMVAAFFLKLPIIIFRNDLVSEAKHTTIYYICANYALG